MVLSSMGLSDISHQRDLRKDSSLQGVMEFLLQAGQAGPVVVHWKKSLPFKEHLEVFVECIPHVKTMLGDGGIQRCM